MDTDFWNYVPPVWQGLLFYAGCLVLGNLLYKLVRGL